MSSKKKSKKTQKTRLLLNEALSQGSKANWSDARKQAWSKIESNPNTYYFRFNAPGEDQKVGKWKFEEQKVFFERFKDLHGVNLLSKIDADTGKIGISTKKLKNNSNIGQWGIFSKKIPGRVGYQCAAFYRTLVKAGKSKDPHNTNFLDDDTPSRFYFDYSSNPANDPLIDQLVAKNFESQKNPPRPTPKPKQNKKKRISSLPSSPDNDTLYTKTTVILNNHLLSRLKNANWDSSVKSKSSHPTSKTKTIKSNIISNNQFIRGLLSRKATRSLAKSGGVKSLEWFEYGGKGRGKFSRCKFKKPTERMYKKIKMRKRDGTSESDELARILKDMKSKKKIGIRERSEDEAEIVLQKEKNRKKYEN
eukprot:TRINITY_DN6153_c0_g1_i2.p1 TRINITY_DN6153_c0_g1~~TRINITY_DN6153_c0_g1_i2.p1  ORF type:complete len:363 (-),score=62.65 TRINITY_DN6153_c0_g1_i2:161-1249(-)